MSKLNTEVIKELNEMKAIGIKVPNEALEMAKTEDFGAWLLGDPCIAEIAVLIIELSNVGNSKAFLKNYLKV
jgi:hypothetical protein